MGVPRILVEVAASIGTFQADFAKAARTADQQARAIQKSIDDIKGSAEEMGKALLGAFGFSLGFEGAIRAFETIRDRITEDERSLNRLQAVLTSTGYAAGLTADQVERIGKSAADNSVFSPEQIREATTALLRFRDVQGDVFRDAVKQIPNLATALGSDPTAAAQLLGRLLTDPTTAVKGLRAAGLELSEQQKDLAARFIETGDKAAGQRIALDALTKSIAGSGEADTKGLSGATSRLTKAWDELEKVAGRKLFGDNHQIIDGISHAIEELAQRADRAHVSLLPFLTGQESAISLGGRAITALRGGDQGTRERSGKIDYSAVEQAKAEEGAQAQRDLIAANKAYELQQATLKRLAANAAAFYGSQLAQKKAYLDQDAAQDEFAYSRGEISAEAFYGDQTKRIQETELATVQASEGEIHATENLRNATKTTAEERIALDQKIDSLRAASLASRTNFSTKQIQLAQQEQLAIEKLADEYAELFAALQERSGNSVVAAQTRFDVANRTLARRIQAGLASPDPGVRGDAQAAQKNFEDERTQVAVQAALNDRNKEFTQILDEVAIKQGYINIEQSTGAISELDALAKTSEANKERIADLQKVYEAYAAIAETSKDPADIIKAQQLKLRLAELASHTDLVADKFRNLFETDMVNALDEFVTGTKSAKDAFKDFANSVVRDIVHIADQQIANAVLGKDTTGAGIIGWLASLFTGSSAGTSSWPTGAGGIPEFASGTDSAPGGIALVGERGPELVNLPQGAQVIPMPNRRSWGGGVTNHNSVAVSVTVPGNTSRSTANQVATEVGRKVSRAMARFN